MAHGNVPCPMTCPLSCPLALSYVQWPCPALPSYRKRRLSQESWGFGAWAGLGPSPLGQAQRAGPFGSGPKDRPFGAGVHTLWLELSWQCQNVPDSQTEPLLSTKMHCPSTMHDVARGQRTTRTARRSPTPRLRARRTTDLLVRNPWIGTRVLPVLRTPFF